MRLYGGHYPPDTQGAKGYTDPRTGGSTCKTNKIIYDAIYASLPDDCKLTFAQMFCNFDNICLFKTPLYFNGKKLNSKSISSIFSLTWNVLNGGTSLLTIWKWKYIDAINSGVQEAIVFVFVRLPKKYWPDQHQEALEDGSRSHPS